jgi:hypothetical protein
MNNIEWDNSEVMQAVIDWTEYSFLEGARETQSSFNSALQYVQHCVKRDNEGSEAIIFPTLTDVIAEQKRKLEALRTAGQRGINKISGDYYYEEELYTDMIKDYEVRSAGNLSLLVGCLALAIRYECNMYMQ